MATINFETRAKIISQALEEISFARNYKQSKVGNWEMNEKLYYGHKVKGVESRANVDLGQMASFVHTILSKIDNPLVFKFSKRKESQVDRVKKLNALRTSDADRDNWDIKDIAGKKQGVVYGRAIYSYYADSEDGYVPHLDNVDVYDFLIDPSAGGIDMEKARFMGDYGVVLSRDDIKEGVKSGIYLKTESQRLLDGSGNNTESSQEKTNKLNRITVTGIASTEKEMQDKDKFKFWRWGTTFEGKRYFLLLCEDGGGAIEVTELKDKFKSNLWWYWSWAAFIDLTEFWTPSYCDYVRDIFMAQAVSINQMLDNGEQITKPQTVVNITAIENLAELKYRRDGIIKVKGAFDITKAFQRVQVAAINTPIEVFTTLEGIQEKASGVTAAAQGVAENNSSSKVTIYKGNEAAVADRFGLLNKSYSFGYKRFATLYLNGVDEHLVKKQAIDILGPDGISVTMVSRRDIFHKDDKFGIIVEASNAELALSSEEKNAKIAFLQAQSVAQPAVQNPDKAYEIGASIAGFDDETIRQLQDKSDYGTESLMSKAERDIERILDGEKVPPNPAATTAYMQRIVDYMTNNQDALDIDDYRNLALYADSLKEVISRNMMRQANEMLFKQQMEQVAQPLPPIESPVPAQPSPMGAV